MVSRARAGTVKIVGIAPSCRQELEGSGFVVSPERVMTNAHVVAGTRRLTVESRIRRTAHRPRRVVRLQQRRRRPRRTRPPPRLPFAFADKTGTHRRRRHLAGLPRRRPVHRDPVRVRNVIRLSGPNIYSSAGATRGVHRPRADPAGQLGQTTDQQRRRGSRRRLRCLEDPPTKPVSFTADQVNDNLETSANRSARVSTLAASCGD